MIQFRNDRQSNKGTANKRLKQTLEDNKFVQSATNDFGPGENGWLMPYFQATKDVRKYVGYMFKTNRENLPRLAAEVAAMGERPRWLYEAMKAETKRPTRDDTMTDRYKKVDEWWKEESEREVYRNGKPPFDVIKQAAYTEFGGFLSACRGQIEMHYEMWNRASWCQVIAQPATDEKTEEEWIRCLSVELIRLFNRVASTISGLPNCIKDADTKCLHLTALLYLISCSKRAVGLPMPGIWVCGPPGSGKSSLCQFAAVNEDRLKVMATDAKGVGRFNVSGQTCILFDDMVGKHAFRGDIYSTMNSILDGCRTSIKVFGATKTIDPLFVMVTSNEKLSKVTSDYTGLEPWSRRFVVVELRPTDYDDTETMQMVMRGMQAIRGKATAVFAKMFKAYDMDSKGYKTKYVMDVRNDIVVKETTVQDVIVNDLKPALQPGENEVSYLLDGWARSNDVCEDAYADCEPPAKKTKLLWDYTQK